MATFDGNIIIGRSSNNINIIMQISYNILALYQGERIAYGTPKEIQNNKQVVDSYLGTYDAA